MTRKHFQRLAQFMRVHKPATTGPLLIMWEDMLADLVVELQAMNPAFDEDKFRDWAHK